MAAKAYDICRRLIVLLDGTWNLDDEEGPATNIVRLREMLSKGLIKQYLAALDKRNKTADQILKADQLFNTVDVAFDHVGASGIVCDGFEYFVYYSQGVGTGALEDQIKGGITGDGLDVSVRQAYNFLSYNFRPGDEIFVFGFSRGAFTARSLCGYLHAFGLLKKSIARKKKKSSPGPIIELLRTIG